MNPTLIVKKNNIYCHSFPVGDLQANCTIISCNKTKEAVIFDPGNDHQGMLSYIEKEGLKVLKLVHTHAHFDHIAGSNPIKKVTNAPMALHRDDLPLYTSLEQQGKMFALNLEPCGEIDEAFNEGDSLNLPDGSLIDWASSIRIIHTPGHSPGGSCFYSDYFETPILIAGDTLFLESIGRTDLLGGDYQQLTTTIKGKLFTLPEDTVVITGHGPTTKIGHEKRRNPFLNKLI